MDFREEIRIGIDLSVKVCYNKTNSLCSGGIYGFTDNGYANDLMV